MIFAIRDDDTSYFTKPEDLEKAYDYIQSGPISLSVVPFTVPIHRDDVFPYGGNIEFGYYPIEKMQILLIILKEAWKKINLKFFYMDIRMNTGKLTENGLQK